MGNCLFGGLGDEEDLLIKVIKSDGGVLKFYSPITVGSVSHEFSGHAIFSALDLLWEPLPHHHHLVPGQSYYLLPNIVSDEVEDFCWKLPREIQQRVLASNNSLQTVSGLQPQGVEEIIHGRIF